MLFVCGCACFPFDSLSKNLKKTDTVFIFTRLDISCSFILWLCFLFVYKIKINKTKGKQSTPKQRYLLHQNLLSLSLSYKISLDLFWISGKSISIAWEIKLDTTHLCFEDHAYAAQSPTTLFFFWFESHQLHLQK